MADDQPMWGNNRAVAPTPGAAIVAVDLGDNFTVKGHHLSMIKDRQFDGRSQADPHKHIVEFVKVCGRFCYGNTNADAIKLKLFPSSLTGEAKIWFNELSPGVITTWEEMRQAFIPPKLGDPGSFLIPCKLANSVEYFALADLGASINLMPYLLYVALSRTTLKPTRMSIRLANHTYQYPMGVAENMLVQVGKFVLPVDFVILVKNKELNLGIGEDRSTFHIDKDMHHSHVNADTCFRMGIDEIIEDELDALLDDSKPFLNTSEKIRETPLDKESDESMTSIQDSPTDLEMKPLPKHLEYAFLEENSLLPVVISALLEQNERNNLFQFSKTIKKHSLGKHPIF
ncbi:reverse transcriptase domain-containing protein [Tanacetum coccineum]